MDMAPEERQARRDWLERLGVPGPYHDAIIDAPTTRMLVWGGSALAVALVAAVVAVMASTFLWLTRYVEARAAEVAAQTGATLTYVNVGLGPLLLLFGLLFFLLWAGSAVAANYRVQGFLTSAAGIVNRHPATKGSTKLVLRWLLPGAVGRAVARTADVDGFLHAVANHHANRLGIATIGLLLPAIAFTALETNSFWVAGAAGVVEHCMFPPFFSRRHDLKAVTSITTGCNNTSKDNLLIYDLHVASGESFNLGAAEPAKSGDVRAIVAIDARLAPNIAHRRWSHLNRDPVHPLCLRHWAAQPGQDGLRRLAKLLRLTPDELRPVLLR
jgi:hypothetical protein